MGSTTMTTNAMRADSVGMRPPVMDAVKYWVLRARKSILRCMLMSTY
jgi:hypothetical protein